MSSSQLLLASLTALSLIQLQVCLQCFRCNVGGSSVQWGCSDSQVMNCSRTDGGFKLKHCITTYSRSLDLVLSRSCATSRHCQQVELPGVSVACCDWSLCNGGWRWAGSVSAVIISLISSTSTHLYDITGS